MIEFSLPWWQFLLVGLGVNVVAYLAGVVVGKSSMLTLMMTKAPGMQGMPSMPSMPPTSGRN